MIGVIVYKLLVYRPLAKSSLTSSYALQIANTSGAVCNLICIMILSRVWCHIFHFWYTSFHSKLFIQSRHLGYLLFQTFSNWNGFIYSVWPIVSWFPVISNISYLKRFRLPLATRNIQLYNLPLPIVDKIGLYAAHWLLLLNTHSSWPRI